ncbi:hypothetical protein BVI1335_400085 [Burkholderia vietnamiensis]|nr:hypothetical protein BVI1335_400085 [Burkholderia vietnamiensis]
MAVPLVCRVMTRVRGAAGGCLALRAGACRRDGPIYLLPGGRLTVFVRLVIVKCRRGGNGRDRRCRV